MIRSPADEAQVLVQNRVAAAESLLPEEVKRQGVTIKKQFYMEASYVSYQTGPETTDFIPVVIGFQF